MSRVRDTRERERRREVGFVVRDARVSRRLTVLEIEPVLLRVADEVERVVVVDVAVLEDLHERRPLVRGGAPQHVRQPRLVGVERPRDERRFGAEGERKRVERVVDRAHRRRARHLPLFRRRRVLALGEPVDLVVEHQDLDVHVAPERVDQVVAADRERVAVAADHPDGQIGPGDGEAGRDRGRAAVDRVHPVRLHVVREPSGAPDARDEDDLLALEPELGHEALHGGEDRIVAAARDTSGPPDPT